MARRAEGGLSKHPTKGYRISLGKKPDGGYKTVWLGHSRVIAEYHAEALRGRFEGMQQEGRDVWTEADLDVVNWHVSEFKRIVSATREHHQQAAARLAATGRVIAATLVDSEAERAARPQLVSVVPAASAARDPTDAKVATLHGAIDAYVATFQAKAVSAAHRERTRQLLEDLKYYRPDLPLVEIDRLWLQTLTDFIRSRPKSRVRRTKLAPLTVRNTLQAWSRFFDWLDANSDSKRFGGWQAPRRVAELFEVRLSALMTKAERDARADGPKHLTAEQVVRLYNAAKNDLHRICILLGVFAALGQKEIATLRRDEFDLAEGILTHRRSKTGQKGQYFLPPEAVALIKRYFRSVPTRKVGVAFVTADGSPLVTETSDAIRQAWVDIVDRVNKDGGPKVARLEQGFYALRKFTADYAMRHGGPVLRDTVLAHAAASVGAKFYSNNRDFQEVLALGRKLTEDLRTLGMFAEKPPRLVP